MAGDHRSGEMVQGVVEALLRQVGNVQGHADFGQSGQQLPASLGEGSLDAGARRVLAVAEVGQRDAAQAVLPPRLQLIRPQDGIGAFHGDNDPHRKVCIRVPLPSLPLPVQILLSAYQCDLSRLFQHPVIGQLALGVGVGHGLGAEVQIEAADGLDLAVHPGRQGRLAHRYPSPSHIRQADGAQSPFQRIRHSLLAPVADRRGLGHVPVVGQGEQGQVQVPVKDRSHWGTPLPAPPFCDCEAFGSDDPPCERRSLGS